MTTKVEIVNRALQVLGTRTTVTDAELTNQTSNEAIQANLLYDQIRQDLLRMAPWNCGLKTANLTYITSTPGTPENQSPGTNLWQRGQPSPPWAYEYQYPVDCLRACWIIPAWNTGFAGGTPIFPVVTGMMPSLYSGPPIRFKVQLDEFYPVTAAAVVAGGSGYAVGDVITLETGPTDEAPIGAPVQLLVATAPAGVVATVTVVNQVLGSATPLGGSYFQRQSGTIAQGSTTGSGTGATFTLTQGVLAPQRVILTNQENASMVYCTNVEDTNIFDSLFQTAFSNILGAGLCMALTGDKTLANQAITLANGSIEQARSADGNEGLTVNDVTPDWIRVRGWPSADGFFGPFNTYDWGGLWPVF